MKNGYAGRKTGKETKRKLIKNRKELECIFLGYKLKAPPPPAVGEKINLKDLKGGEGEGKLSKFTIYTPEFLSKFSKYAPN